MTEASHDPFEKLWMSHAAQVQARKELAASAEYQKARNKRWSWPVSSRYRLVKPFGVVSAFQGPRNHRTKTSEPRLRTLQKPVDDAPKHATI